MSDTSPPAPVASAPAPSAAPTGQEAVDRVAAPPSGGETPTGGGGDPREALRRLAAQVAELRQQLLLRMLTPPAGGGAPRPAPAPADGSAAAAIQQLAAAVSAPGTGPRLLLIAYGGFLNPTASPIIGWSFDDPLQGASMQTSPTSAASAAGVNLTANGAENTALRDGQTVRATVLSVEGGQVNLRIGNQTLQLQSPVPLQQGQTLDLQVQRLQDLLVLRLLTAPRLSELVSSGIREALPQQGGLPPLLANLQALARGEAPMPTPRELNQLAGRFLQQLPELRNLITEEGVRQAVRESGLFLEAKLAQAARSGGEGAAAAVQQDLKGSLLKLLAGLRSLETATQSTTREGAAPRPQGAPPPPADPATLASRPPPPLPNAPVRAQPAAQPNLAAMNDFMQLRNELVRQTQSAVARVQLGQLSSVRTDPDANPQWMVEVPVRNGDAVDMVQIRIESRGAKRARKGAKSWAVSLALDLGKLGPMEARVTLGEDESVSTLFWSEREEATRAIETNLPLLQRNLNDCGLKVGRLGARTGEAPAGDEPALPVSLNLLDLKA